MMSWPRQLRLRSIKTVIFGVRGFESSRGQKNVYKIFFLHFFTFLSLGFSNSQLWGRSQIMWTYQEEGKYLILRSQANQMAVQCLQCPCPINVCPFSRGQKRALVNWIIFLFWANAHLPVPDKCVPVSITTSYLKSSKKAVYTVASIS